MSSAALARPLTTAEPAGLLWRLYGVFAVAALLAALAAVGLGGVVRITGSGLGCPDWPVCYGSFIPPFQLEAWIEYVHRLGGATVGVFGLGLLATAFLSPRVGWSDRALVVLAELLYATQVILGAATVLWEIPPVVAATHFAFATALVGTLALVTAGAIGPLRRLTASLANVPIGRYAWGWVAFCLLAFLTVVAGTVLTRSGAAAVCTGFPLCDTALDGATLRGLQDIHMLHRWLGYATFFAAAGMVLWTVRLPSPRLLIWTGLVEAAVLLQVLLGVVNVLAGLPQWSRAGHVLVATVVFALAMLVFGAVWRGREPAAPPAESA